MFSPICSGRRKYFKYSCSYQNNTKTPGLERLGLTEAEIAVYLDLFRNGPGTATELAKRTDLNRSHIYEKIDSLISKGLVSFVVKNHARTFRAGPAERLLECVKEIETDIINLIPKLTAARIDDSQETSVEIYQGKEGMKTVFKDVIRLKENYVVLGEEGKFQQIFPVFIKQFLRDVAHYDIKERIISKESCRGTIAGTKNTQIRYLSDKYLSPSMIAVYGTKTAIWIWSEPLTTILINSKSVADSFRSYFDVLWAVAK